MTAILLLTALAASPTLQSYGFEATQVKESVIEASLESTLPSFPASEAVKALPASARASAVKLLASFVKSYAQSAEFKAAYAARLKEVRAPKPAPKKSYEQLVKARRAELDKQYAEMETTFALLSKELQAEARRNTAQMRRGMEELLKDRAALEQQEQIRFEAEEEDYREGLERYPEDPKLGIKKVLSLFLQETAGIDYSAKLKDGDFGKKVFLDPKLEEKSGPWKMGYRAGREATETARSFVQEWLKELN